MKMIRYAAFLAITAGTFISCVTGPSPEVTKNDFSQKGPTQAVLAYGAFIDSRPMFPYQLERLNFIQVTPALKPQDVYAVTNRGAKNWYAADVEPGGSFKLIYSETIRNRTIYIYVPGVQGKTAIDFRAPKEPGLFFAGEVRIRKDGDNQVDNTPETELKILKSMVQDFAGSEWQPVIMARVKELENAKSK